MSESTESSSTVLGEIGGHLGSPSEALTAKIRALLADQLGVDIAEMRPNAHILDDLGADSLDVVEMIMAIEEKFDLEIADEDAEAMQTVGDVEVYVTARIA